MSKYVVDGETGCWNFLGCKNKDGYGVMRIGGLTKLAHRVFYEKKNGTIPKGVLICHHCDNPLCVNPEHLFAGTVQDNMDDMRKKGRAYGKLTREDVVKIRASRHTNSMLSKSFGVAERTIRYAKQKNADGSYTHWMPLPKAPKGGESCED